MTHVMEEKTAATRNRHSPRDDALLWRECAEDEEEPPESAAQHVDSEEENQEEKEQEQVGGPAECNHVAAPDGGWGWVVVGASVFIQSVTLALPACMGIFYKDLQTELSASNAEISWVPGIMTAVMLAGGPLCSVLVERCGCRTTVMAGGLLSGLGMAVSSLVRTTTELYITSSITGLGCCFSFQPSVTIVGHYFVQHRVFANALSSIGPSLGNSILPAIINALLSQFGWRGSFLILSGVLLNCCVCGALMRPIASGPNKHRHSEVLHEPNKGSVKTVLGGTIASLQRHLAFDLLMSNARYRAYLVGVSWTPLAYMLPLFYLIPHAAYHNIASDRATLLLSVPGLMNIAVRPLVAFIMGMPRFKGSSSFAYVFAGSVILNGLADFVCGAAASFEALLLFVVMFALSTGVGISLTYTVLMDTVEMSRFHSAFGFLCLLQSILVLIGPPLGGMLVDHTGQYSFVFYTCGACISSAGLFLAGSFYFLDCKRDKEEKKKSIKKPSDL
ncbi:monocarboxylate transporter 6 [Symphorus nematophorus]